MTGYLYPRLADGHALARFVELQEIAYQSIAGLREQARFEHNQAAPVPTGGTVASGTKISQVRTEVMTQMAPLISENGHVAGPHRIFDWMLGRALFHGLQIVVSDAAHKSTWNFLSTSVFPDLVWARFPDPSEDRVLGGSRNVLRRAWMRYDLLNELEGHGAEDLNEDELVQITERTALARNRGLAVAVARSVIRHEGPRRMEYTRVLCKRVVFLTGPLLLDTLLPAQLDELVSAVAKGERWEPGADGRRQAGGG
ncbi:hypothetical protein JNB_00265 [Janibacter sp. HTCC2649]|nr:hypothetical protein JNB_00265 [Janibacter sp. HTCC2649]